jgi:hypothetical protein
MTSPSQASRLDETRVFLGSKQPLEEAIIWVRDLTSVTVPEHTDNAVQAAQQLVAAALKRTSDRITVSLRMTERGLRIEVHDPSQPSSNGLVEVAELSKLSTSFGSGCSAKGHIGWIELRGSQ